MSDKLTPIMRKKIESATQIINDYSGENIYFKFLKYLSENKGIKVDKHSQKLVHRYKDIKPKTINKWVKTHPFFNVYYNRIIDGKQMIPYDGHIYIEQILKVSANNIEFWGKIYQNQNSSFRYEIPKNYFIDKIVEDLDVNLDIDFKSRKPLKHQKPAVEFLLKRKKAILGDQMGLGKTFSSIYAAMVGGFEKILVICPASLKYNWKREIGFLDDPDNVSILNSNRFEQNKWTIVNYDILKNFHRLPLNEKGNMCDRSDFTPSPFESAEYDLIIVDEAHYLKSNKSQRSKLFKDFAQFSEYIWLLTGTPIPNKVENIFNLLSLINSPLSNNQDYFLLRYCNGYKSRIGNRQIIKTRGGSNLQELRDMLEFDMIRRTKHSAGVDLPDKLIRAIYLSLDGEYKYRQLLGEYEDWVAENEDREITLSDHLQQLVKIRMMLSEAKIAATIETIEGFIEQEKKVVVFSCFSNTIKQIHDHFGKKSVLVDGKVKGDKRQKAVDMFQNNKKVHVFCGNIIAAGVGLTLTKGTVVIFNDLDWVPANHMQAEDRCYRIGQNEDVNILYMLFEDSLDELMYESLNKKRGNIDIATGDVNEVQFSVAQEVIKSISDITK